MPQISSGWTSSCLAFEPPLRSRLGSRCGCGFRCGLPRCSCLRLEDLPHIICNRLGSFQLVRDCFHLLGKRRRLLVGPLIVGAGHNFCRTLGCGKRMEKSRPTKPADKKEKEILPSLDTKSDGEHFFHFWMLSCASIKPLRTSSGSSSTESLVCFLTSPSKLVHMEVSWPRSRLAFAISFFQFRARSCSKLRYFFCSTKKKGTIKPQTTLE